MLTSPLRTTRTAVPVLALAAWSIALPMMGCYSYVPVESNATPKAGDVSLQLTNDGTTAVQQTLGQNVRSIDGTLVRATADSLELLVSDVYTVTRERFPQNSVRATIARAHVERTSQKVFSRKRTWTLVLGVAAVIATALGATTAASASSSGQGGNGGIQP